MVSPMGSLFALMQHRLLSLFTLKKLFGDREDRESIKLNVEDEKQKGRRQGSGPAVEQKCREPLSSQLGKGTSTFFPGHRTKS